MTLAPAGECAVAIRQDRRMVAARSGGGRRRMSAEDRRDHLLDAAADLLVERGVDALAMETVAVRAGVSKSLGWAYFDNIGQLVRELFERELSLLYDRIEAAIAQAEGFDARASAAVAAYFDVVQERGRLLAAVQAAVAATGHVGPPGGGRLERFIVALGGLVRDGYDVEWPEALAQAAVVAAVVHAWSDVLAFSAGYGAMTRADAEERALRWITAGLAASLPPKQRPRTLRRAR